MIARKRLTVHDALPIYLSLHPHIRPRTVRELLYNLNRWSKIAAEQDIAAITAETFDDFREKSNHSPTTIEATVRAVRGVLAACERRGLIERVPHIGIRSQIPEPQPRIVALESLSRFYQHCGVALWPGKAVPRGRGRGCVSTPHSWAADFWRVFLVVAFFTGLRLGDLLQLTRRHFEGDLLAVKASKTNKVQTFPLHPVVTRHVRAAKWCRIDAPMFPVGGSVHQFTREMKRISAAAGVETITAKTIRIVAGNAWEAAWPTAGAALLGHSIFKGATRFYLRPSPLLESALPRLKVPDAFLNSDEREHGRDRFEEMRRHWERMPTDSQDLLLGMARRIG